MIASALAKKVTPHQERRDVIRTKRASSGKKTRIQP